MRFRTAILWAILATIPLVSFADPPRKQTCGPETEARQSSVPAVDQVIIVPAAAQPRVTASNADATATIVITVDLQRELLAALEAATVNERFASVTLPQRALQSTYVATYLALGGEPSRGIITSAAEKGSGRQ